MSNWTDKLFIERSDLFLKLMNQRWLHTDELINGITAVLRRYGISSGILLDLCCGNGRVSIHMAKKGFRAVGLDFSKTFLDDARRRADEHGVSKTVTFLEGDVRKLKEALRSSSESFDVVINAWTSVGFFSVKDDFNVFKQARELSRQGAILIIAETMHTEFLSAKFTPTSYTEINDIMMLKNRKYDPTTSKMNESWIFYEKSGENLKFIDRVEIELHVYSPSELTCLLRNAGWEPLAFYGSFSTLQPMSPLTSLNIVARAR